MKEVLIIVCIFSLYSCNSNKKNIIKEVSSNNITVQWYYYDRFRERSADFVDVIKNDRTETIYESSDILQDFKVSGNKITLKLYKPYRGVVYSSRLESKIFGYEIIADTNVTRNDYYKSN